MATQGTADGIPRKPGLYPGIPFDDYRAIDAVNNSSLGPMGRSPAHYRAALLEPRPPTEARRFGSFVHEMRFDPVVAIGRYVVAPDFAAEVEAEHPGKYAARGIPNTIAYREKRAAFAEANREKVVVTGDKYAAAAGICRALAASRRTTDLLDGAETELTILWVDRSTQLLCKARLDAANFGRRRAGDLKTTEDAAAFEWAIHRFGYDRQAAFYSDGLETLLGQRWTFDLVAAEKMPPFGVRAAEVGYPTLLTGRTKYRQALQRIAECRKSGVWPGYDDPTTWELPESKQAPVNLIVGGTAVTL